MEGFGKISKEGSKGSWSDWCQIPRESESTFEGLIRLEESDSESRFVGIVQNWLLFGNENFTVSYFFATPSYKKQYFIGKAIAVFNDAFFLQTLFEFTRVSFKGEIAVTKLIEKGRFGENEFFPFSSSQLLQVNSKNIALYKEQAGCFKKVWVRSRDQDAEKYPFHRAAIASNSILYIEALHDHSSSQYSYFNLDNGSLRGPSPVTTPYLWPISKGRFLGVVRKLDRFLLVIHYPDNELNVLSQWPASETSWISSNADWALLRIEDKTAVIHLTYMQECFIGTFSSPFGALYSQDQVLFYSTHTLFLYELSTLKCTLSVRLENHHFDTDVISFFIKNVHPTEDGCVALVAGETTNHTTRHYLKHVSFNEKGGVGASSDIPRTKAPLSPKKPLQSPNLEQELKMHLSPSGGIVVAATDWLWSYGKEGDLIINLPCKPLAIGRDWAWIQVGEELHLQGISKFEKKQYQTLLVSDPVSVMANDSLLIAGYDWITLYHCHDKVERYVGLKEPVIRVHVHKMCAYIVTSDTQKSLFWAHVYDMKKECQFVERLSFYHSDICPIGDFILGVRKKKEVYYFFSKNTLDNSGGSRGIDFAYGSDFKWLGEDGTWAMAACGDKLYLIKGADPMIHFVLERTKGACLLGKGFLATWKGHKIEIIRIGEVKPFQEEYLDYPIADAVIREGELVCLTQKPHYDLSPFQIENRALKLPFYTISQKKIALFALPVLALFAYYCYLRKKEGKRLPLSPPSPLPSAPLLPPKLPSKPPLPPLQPPLSPPKRVPIKIRLR